MNYSTQPINDDNKYSLESKKSFKEAFVKNNDWSQYSRYAERLIDSPYLPETLEEFTRIMYNTDNSYARLVREYRTIERINKTSENVERDIKTYYQFRKDNIEMTDHAIYDYHLRMYKKDGTLNYDYNKMVEVIKQKPNYFDENTNRNVNFYDNICVISEVGTEEIVSIRKSRLNKKWKKL